MNRAGAVRWGILSTASIAQESFLPALRQTGTGEAVVVAGRNLARAQEYARLNGIDRAVSGYQALIEDPDVDALYIALPNALHAAWTIAALEAGKPVLCEKPLCGNLADTDRVLSVAHRTGTWLWEAFVFLFHPQMASIRAFIEEGAIGRLCQIRSGTHFAARGEANIRFSRELQGGALLDMGCYPVRFAQELFGDEFLEAAACGTVGGKGVDFDVWGVVRYPDNRQLQLSCGFGYSNDSVSVVAGTEGKLVITSPFHPRADDYFDLIQGKSQYRREVAWPGGDEFSFTPAIRHINEALRREVEPMRLAVSEARATAVVLQELADSFALLGRGDPRP